jgi:hypothetical protein
MLLLLLLRVRHLLLKQLRMRLPRFYHMRRC